MDTLAPPLGVAAFLASLAAIVLLARPARRLNQVFAGLLLLRAASTAALGLSRAAETPAEALTYGRLSVWYALATPFLLLAILGLLLRGRARRAMPLGLTLAALVTVGLGYAHATVPGALMEGIVMGASGTYRFVSTVLLDVFSGATALLEAAVVVVAARRCASPQEDGLSRRQAGLLGLAFAIGTVWAGAFFLLFALVSPSALSGLTLFTRALPTALALAAVAFSLPSLTRGLGGWPRAATIGVLGAAFSLGLLDALAATVPAVARVLPGYDTGAMLIRASFAAAVAIAMLRYGLAGLPPAAVRRGERLARVGIALAAVLLVGGLPLAVLGVTTAGLVAGPLLGIGALLLSPTPIVARLARQVLLPPGDARHDEAALDPDRGGADPVALLGRYRIQRELGRGASATALLATDALKGGHVVVKRFHAPSSHAAVMEARALATVRHPRIVPLLDVERVGAETFLVLGHLPGGTARESLERDGPMPPARAVGLALDVLEALEALHARGIVHGDVKPENVLLDAEGRGVLGDLGSARFVAVDVTVTGAQGGVSLSTVAPEVLRGERPAPASDLYAVGAMLYRLLAGRHYVALEGVTAFEARERVLLDTPRLPDPRVPPGLDETLLRALSKRPAGRHAGAAEMAAAMRAASLDLVDERGAAYAQHVPRTEGAGLSL